jgi:hypothetical protein
MFTYGQPIKLVAGTDAKNSTKPGRFPNLTVERAPRPKANRAK